MKPALLWLLGLALWLGNPVPGRAAEGPKPAEVGTTEAFRQWLIGTKWFWENVKAPAPRSCIFMADGTFRPPRFIAKFTVKSPREVELTRKGEHGTERAFLTFDAACTHFEAIDFNDAGRITGSLEAGK